MCTTNCNHFYGIASPITTTMTRQQGAMQCSFESKALTNAVNALEGCDSREKEFQGFDCTHPARTDVTPKSACASVLWIVGKFNSNNIVWLYIPLSLFALCLIIQRQFWVFSARLRDSKWINVTFLHLLPSQPPLSPFSFYSPSVIVYWFLIYLIVVALVCSRIAVFGEFSVSWYISTFKNWFRFVGGLLTRMWHFAPFEPACQLTFNIFRSSNYLKWH